MEYTFRELECFLAVAEELSFTRAARRLNLAQPPLSRHIRMLEERIGAALFLREPRRVSLTAAGVRFQEETRTIPQRLLRAGEAARRCARGETERLRIGFVSAVMNDALAGVLRSFRKNHPEIEILLHDVSPAEQRLAIGEGRLDGGFIGMETGEPSAGLEEVPWLREPVCCFIPQGHALAARKRVALERLRDESWIAVSRAAAPAFARFVEGLCKEAGFRPRVILESPRAQAVALMVAAGSGIALLPATLARWVEPGVIPLQINGSPRITQVFAVRKGERSAALASLVALLLK